MPYSPKNSIYASTVILIPHRSNESREVAAYTANVFLTFVVMIERGIIKDAAANKQVLFIGIIPLIYTNIIPTAVNSPPLAIY